MCIPLTFCTMAFLMVGNFAEKKKKMWHLPVRFSQFFHSASPELSWSCLSGCLNPYFWKGLELYLGEAASFWHYPLTPSKKMNLLWKRQAWFSKYDARFYLVNHCCRLSFNYGTSFAGKGNMVFK